MRTFNPETVEDYELLLEYLVNCDQPVYIYQVTDKSFMVAEKEIENIDTIITDTGETKDTESLDILNNTELEGLSEDDLEDLADSLL